MGTIATIGIGLVAAFGGGAIGYNANLGFGVTVIIQLALAVVLVLVVGGALRGRARR